MQTHEPFSLTSAWDHLRGLIAGFVRVFYEPSLLAALRLVLPKTRFEFLQFLAPLEAAARRLLLLEALAHPKPNADVARAPQRDKPVPSLLADRAGSPFSAPELPEDSRQWRVVFNLWPGRYAGRAGRTFDPMLARGPRFRDENVSAIARRLEALIRLAENRKHAVARMARLLVWRAGEARERFARYAPGPRPRAWPAQSLIDDLCAELSRAFDAPLADSS
jgi:hypothetical protein